MLRRSLIPLVLASSSIALASCATGLMSNTSLADHTAFALGYQPGQVTIVSRPDTRDPLVARYVVNTPGGQMNCTIVGGGLYSFGQTSDPECRPVRN